MGTPITGREILLGAKRGTTWGTAVACGANDGVLALGFDLNQTLETLPDQPLGAAFDTDTQSGREATGGSLTAALRYEGLDLLLALAMGTAGAPTQVLATTAYQHLFQLADNCTGLFATMAAKKKSDLVFEYPSVKVTGFRIRGGFRMPTEITFDLMGDTLVRNGGSGTNNTTSIASVTYRTKQNRVIVDENAYVRTNASAGSGLAASDNIYPSEFELVFRRPQEGDHVVDQTSYMSEPVGTANPEATLSLTFPTFGDTGDTLWTAFVGSGITKTAQKLEIYAQGALIEAGQPYRILVQIPQAYATEISANPTSPGKIPNPVSFRLTQRSAAPTGMTGVTNPFAIKLVNTKTTDALA